MNAHAFLPPALQAHPYGASVARILQAAIAAVEPAAALRRHLAAHPLPPARRVFLLAVGKAAAAMSAAALEAIGDRLAGGLLIPKHPVRPPHPHLRVIVGEHPVPGAGSLRAGQEALALAAALRPDDLLLCLISGGGSALMTAPLAGLPLEALQALTAELLACGARIDEVNTLRRHLDQVKGGRLAAATRARVVSLILSDVVGSPLEAIASGPTAPDPTDRAAARAILRRYGLETAFPAVAAALAQAPETPKPGAACFRRTDNHLIADNAQAVRAALRAAAALGFHSQNLGSHWQGEARRVGAALSARLLAHPASPPFCLVAGGETTVTLRGEGLGGRNQELALAAVERLAGQPGVMLVTLATDGEDGPTDAAGAVVTGETLSRARALGLDPAAHLARNDAYRFFAPLGALLRPGPTGTNVNDLTFLFGFPKSRRTRRP